MWSRDEKQKFYVTKGQDPEKGIKTMESEVG